jgi:hypothetical protein
MNHITKEKATEIELEKQEKEWLREASKAQVAIDQATKQLDLVKKKTKEVEEKFNLESIVVQEAPLTDKLDFLGKLKSVGIEAQHIIEEWHMFSHHLLLTTPTIYQTTFEGVSQLEQSGATSTYRKDFQFFNPTTSELNVPEVNHQSRTPEIIIEGSEESHIQVKATPLPSNIHLHAWESPQETNPQTIHPTDKP